jgi:hypothetical protein
MSTWEIEVEILVRKTLVFDGRLTENAARSAAAQLVSFGEVNPSVSAHYKWTDGRTVYRPTPIEVVIDNNPSIVSARQVSS